MTRWSGAPLKVFLTVVVLSVTMCLNLFVSKILKDRSADPLLIYIVQPPSNHSGALQSLDFFSFNPDCQTGGPGCLSQEIPACPDRCELTTNYGRKRESFAHMFQPDETFNAIPLPYPYTLFRIIYGHEPFHRTPKAYDNESFIEHFNVALHWGTGADVTTNFYYFDRLFGKFSARWWKHPPFGRKSFGLESFTFNKSRGGVSLVYSNGYSKRRNTFVYKWMKSIPTRSFGQFHWNSNFTVELEENGQYSRQLQKIEQISQFPFHLIVESTDSEPGWVTEKVYEAFAAGTVPIYWGSSDVFNVIPENSIIYVTDNNISDTSKLVKDLLNNPTSYLKYHEWRNKANTGKLFSTLIENGRTTAACRLCMHLHKAIRSKSIPGPLKLTSKGWRHSF